jgi:hypothetical protein
MDTPGKETRKAALDEGFHARFELGEAGIHNRLIIARI